MFELEHLQTGDFLKMGFSELEGNLVVDHGKKTLSCTMKKEVSCNTFNQFSPVS